MSWSNRNPRMIWDKAAFQRLASSIRGYTLMLFDNNNNEQSVEQFVIDGILNIYAGLTATDLIKNKQQTNNNTDPWITSVRVIII